MLNPEPNLYTIEHLRPSDKKDDKKPAIRSAHDLRRKEFDPIAYIVPGYIA